MNAFNAKLKKLSRIQMNIQTAELWGMTNKINQGHDPHFNEVQTISIIKISILFHITFSF